MKKPFYMRIAVLSLLSLPLLATMTGYGADNEVPVVVKIAGIPWFTAMEKGIKEAGKETGLDASMVPVFRFVRPKSTAWRERTAAAKAP